MKIKGLFILTGLFLSGLLLHGQNFAPLNTTWHFQDYRFDCSPNYFIKIQAERDTLIDNKYVTILEVYDNDIYVPEGRLYIHEDNNQVFFYEEDQFKLLYDFNLSKGDTLITSIPLNRTFYDFSYSNGDLAAAHLKNYKTTLIIDSVSFSIIDGTELKTLHTRTAHEDEINDCFEFRKITERIGSELGLCGQHCYQCLAGCSGYLRCYADPELDYHPASEDCDLGLNAVSDLELLDFLIYPNPTHSYINLDQRMGADYYKLYDVDGKMIIQENIQLNAINVNYLKRGIYVLVLYNDRNELLLLDKLMKK